MATFSLCAQRVAQRGAPANQAATGGALADGAARGREVQCAARAHGLRRVTLSEASADASSLPAVVEGVDRALERTEARPRQEPRVIFKKFRRSVSRPGSKTNHLRHPLNVSKP